MRSSIITHLKRLDISELVRITLTLRYAYYKTVNIRLIQSINIEESRSIEYVALNIFKFDLMPRIDGTCGSTIDRHSLKSPPLSTKKKHHSSK